METQPPNQLKASKNLRNRTTRWEQPRKCTDPNPEDCPHLTRHNYGDSFPENCPLSGVAICSKQNQKEAGSGGAQNLRHAEHVCEANTNNNMQPSSTIQRNAAILDRDKHNKLTHKPHHTTHCAKQTPAQFNSSEQHTHTHHNKTKHTKKHAAKQTNLNSMKINSVSNTKQKAKNKNNQSINKHQSDSPTHPPACLSAGGQTPAE